MTIGDIILISIGVLAIALRYVSYKVEYDRERTMWCGADTMTEEQEIEKLKRHNKKKKKKLKFLRKQNKELWKRVQNNIIADVAREMSGCKNKLI